MIVPYHLLQASGSVIFAAQEVDILSFNTSMEHLSTWKYPVKATETPSELAADAEASATVEAPPTPEGPPTKRRRTENDEKEAQAGDAGTPNSTNGQKKGRFHNKPQPVNLSNEKPFINCLLATANGSHVIAATGSDKTIWVFEHDGSGNLKQLSQRAMPKRPCSLTLTTDQKTILSADKFGDVYALPLLPSAEPTLPPTVQSLPSRSATPASAPIPFKPQANDKTVHTKRNLKALENQKISMELSLKAAAEKSAEESQPAFEHTLLLGHVSMLTAITVAPGIGATGEKREWIITADRDEHVRVSRGIPQAYFIEGFCLGHEDFVSRLCVVPGREELLVSGGGDDDVFLWRWKEKQLLGRANILEEIKNTIEPELTKVAVSRLKGLSLASGETVVAVICEKYVPLLIAHHTFRNANDIARCPARRRASTQRQPPQTELNGEEMQKLLYTTESLRKMSDFD
ncbi:uncharacterized protein PODANS_1_10310 [Podospora anserina S mat+]|uniref:Podospora anserina S mat+ genomic DNA chromosome 1, supercontig 2 n=1 Tax=Podospora anserina (strain S / ATCC MYA-4624 / DSM 980 / FGSC 10383) TaxID=515849 RepID=B2AY93_PODAN|nr:uncharacterized protein PODANS_1_10310 [Podospora anserina S mat+]CAP69367.1 unnamed protein product [Podospora anserina S mat+]